MVPRPASTRRPGWRAALRELGPVARTTCVGVGDAENDHALPDAVRVLRRRRQRAARAQGDRRPRDRRRPRRRRRELIERLIADDLAELDAAPGAAPRPARHAAGRRRGAHRSATARAAGRAAPSGSGKSTLDHRPLERLMPSRLPVLRHRPRGRLRELRGRRRPRRPRSAPPAVDEVLDAAEEPGPERRREPARRCRSPTGPPFFAGAAAARSRSCGRAPAGRTGWSSTRRTTCCRRRGAGRPHAAARADAARSCITVHPEHAGAGAVLATVNAVVAVGRAPAGDARGFADGQRPPAPPVPRGPCRRARRCLVPAGTSRPVRSRSAPRAARGGATRASTPGRARPDRSFLLPRPGGQAQPARAEPRCCSCSWPTAWTTATWAHHLQPATTRAGCASSIKDDELADEVAAIEGSDADTGEPRALVRAAIERRYTLPA